MNFINQMEPLFGQEEADAIAEYMKANPWLTEFRETEKFERLICDFTGARHCVVVNNGTVSLSLALLSGGITKNSLVVVPNYTMIATPNSVKLIGAEVLFCDVEKASLCLDFDKFKSLVETSKNKIDALIYVAANGRYPVNYTINELVSYCKEKNILLVEDAAQALGSYYPCGTHIGLKGSLGSISFSAPKIISTGQGGALITNDSEIYDNLRRMKDFGRNGGGNDIHDSIGWNFKFTDLQAVVGCVQMGKLRSRVDRKKAIFLRYYKALNECSGVEIINNDVRYTAPWFIEIRTNNREGLIHFLRDEGIGTRKMYPPINKQKAYFNYNMLEFEVANEIGSKGLWLPSSVQLTDEEIDKICRSILRFSERNDQN